MSTEEDKYKEYLINSYSDSPDDRRHIIKYGYPEFNNYYRDCEMDTKRWWVNNIKSNWNIIDAGANVGVYTMLFIEKCNKVYAIEPCKTTFELLKLNLKENLSEIELKKIDLINVALSNHMETKTDKIYHRWGSEPIIEEFKFTTIDKLVSDNKLEIHAIKIDVDSYDYEVLQGCRELLKTQHPIVIVEISIQALALRNNSKDDIMKYMNNLNYINTDVFNVENHLFIYQENVKILEEYKKNREKEEKEMKKEVTNENIKKMKLDDKDYLQLAFNSDGYVMNEVKHLIKHANLKYGIETGTYSGSTSVFLSDHLSLVHTIEINNENYNRSERNFQILDKNNIILHHGSSEVVFKTLLPKIKEEIGDEYILFYLDAHWNDYWPLLDELELIFQYIKDKAIIIIDDFQVPNRNFGFDSYKGQPANFEYVKNKLDKIYSNGYTYWYNGFCKPILSYKNTAGKLYVVPNSIKIDWIENGYSNLNV